MLAQRVLRNLVGDDGKTVNEEKQRMGTRALERQSRTHIFIASNCSFFGITSSIYGASRGYVVVICVRIAR